MVAIFTGVGAGFERGSRAALGATGLLGSSSFGRDGQGVFLNAASGNLLITDQDEFLVGRGPDIGISRTYNSLGALDDNGDYWRQSTDKRVYGLVGSANTAGSAVKRISADGSEIVYTWTGSYYEANEGAGATDRLLYSSSNGTWTFTDGDTQVTETYSTYGTDNWRITEQKDNDGNKLSFTYTSDKLTRITTEDGSYTDYLWTGSNITSIVTSYTNLATQTSSTLTRTRYDYDGSNRLITVTTDLTPEDNSISDGKVYTTSYTYYGSTKLIASISQTDGARLDITYDSLGRVTQIAQAVASGDVRTTSVTYYNYRTEVIDPRGQVTTLHYNAVAQLTKIVAPPAQTGAAPQTVEFEYAFPPGNLSAQGAGIVKQGEQSYGGVPVDWTITTGIVNGREAVSVTKPWGYLQPWDNWNNPGSVFLRGGDRPDGSFSVTGGETVGYRFASHFLDAARYVVSQIVFVDAQGNTLGTAGDHWNNTWNWSQNTGIGVVPDGAVAAFVQVRPMDHAEPTSSAFGFAFTDFQFHKLAAGATSVPEWTATPNLMWGGDLSAGTSIIEEGAPAGGGVLTPWVVSITTVGGLEALSVTKPYGYQGSDGWNAPGSFFLAGGDRPDGTFSVRPGEVFAYRFSLYPLNGTDHVNSIIEFLDASGNAIPPEKGWVWNETPGWSESYASGTAPANTVAARVVVRPLGWLVPGSTAMGVAIRQIQVHKLPAGTSIVPQWNDATPVGKLLRVADATGAKTNYTYDVNGNIAGITDANGGVIHRAYDANNNLVLETRTGSFSNGASGAFYSRYVYDAENHLRYAISAEGHVAEYRYTTAGELEFTIQYTQAQHLYSLGSAVPSLSTMDSWRDGLSDRSLVKVSQIVYDARGSVKETLSWGHSSASGVHDNSEGYSQSLFTYDQAGQLLNRNTVGQQVETFVYDGMGRVILSTDLTGGTTSVFFNDAAMTTVVKTAWNVGTSSETASSYITTSTYNKAGELVSRLDSGSAEGGNYTTSASRTYLYDKNGQMRRATDATGQKSYFLYDKTGRKIADIGYSGELTEYHYGQAGRAVAVARYTNKLNSTQISTLDNPNSEVEIASIRPTANAYDIWQWSVYDTGGRVIETIGGDGAVTRYQYDQADRLVSTTGYFNKLSAGQISAFISAAPAALILPPTDTRDAVARIFHDGDGRVVGTLNAEGILSRVVYDAAGQKVQEIAYATATAVNLRQTGTFNALSASAGTDPSRDISTRYVYDGQGLLRYTIDALNRVTEYIYWAGTASQAIGRVRKTTSYAAPLGALSAYDLNTLATAVAGLANGASDRTAYNVYNDRGQLSYSADPIGAVVGFAYDIDGRVIKATQFATLVNMASMGAETQWKANLDAWAASNGAGARVTRSYYSERGEVRFVIDAEGYVTQNDYDAEGRLYTQYRFATGVAATDGWTIATVDGASKGSSVTNQFRYDMLGRLADVYDAVGVRRSTLYYANGTKESDIVAYAQGSDEVRTTYRYDQSGKLSQTLFAADSSEQAVESYQYDGFGNMKSVTDANNGTTYFTHDKIGRVLTQTDALGGVTRYGYDAFGRNAVTVDARGNASYSYYDQAGRVVGTVDAENYVTKTTYTAFGEIASVTHYSNKELSNYLSWWAAGGTGYKLATETIDGDLVLTARNSVGEVPSWHPAAWGGEIRVMPGNLSNGRMAVTPGDTVSVSFDTKTLVAGLRVQAKLVFYRADGSKVEGGFVDSEGTGGWQTITTSMTAPQNAVSVLVSIFSYRPDANTTGGFDIAIREPEILHNGVAHVIPKPNVAVDADDATTTFQYDKLGRVTRVTDTLGAYEQYTLDAFGQRTAVRNKLGGVTYNTFDKRGLLVEETLPISAQYSNGAQQAATVKNQFEYDARGNRTRMIEAATLAEQRTTIYQYDAANRLIAKSGDAIGVSASALSAATTITPAEQYFYDLRGNVIESRDAAGARTLRWYDKLDRVTHTLSPTGTLTRNFYDPNSNLTEIRIYATLVALPADATGAPPANAGAYRVSQFSYDALNRMTESRTPSIRTAAYGSGFAVTTQTLTSQVEYDAAGNVVRTTDANGGKIYSYYDKLGRKTVQIDAGNYRTDWTYDSDGNVLQERRHSQPSSAPASIQTPPAAPAQTADDRVTSFVYNRMGWRTSEVRSGVKVNDSVNPGAHTIQNPTISYSYNALGQVVQKIEGSGDATNYTYDLGGRLALEQRAGFLDFNGGWVSPTVDYYYNGLNDLVRSRQYGASGAAQRVTTYAYGAGGRLASMTDAENFTHYYSYDATGRLVREEYDLNGERTAAGYDYDLEGRVTRQGLVALQGGVWNRNGLDTVESQYNAFGEVIERGMNGNHAEKFAYDDAGRLWRTTSGDGTWKYLMYDAAGNQTLAIASTGTDIGNQSLDWVLDRWGSDRAAIGTGLVSGAPVDGVVATITTYDKRNQAVSVREPQRERASGVYNDLTTTRAYTAFGEVAFETSAAGHRIDYAYNTMGRLILTTSPTVSITLADGTTQSVRPTEHSYYDKSGRLVGSRDANGNLTQLTLLAGTGYGASQALVKIVKTADSAVVTTEYDIHGDARRITDQIARVTTQLFDKMGRVLEVNRPGGLSEYHRYDGLGQKIKRWNSQLGFDKAELTSYDRQGRIAQHTAMGGDVTSYAYAWNGNIATAGLGSFGGWHQTTTYANGKTLNEDTDQFGRLVSKADLGDHVSQFEYDMAGRLARRTGGDALDYTYLNSGRLETMSSLTGTVASHNWNRRTSTYGYDAVGNLVSERYVQEGEVSGSNPGWWEWLGPGPQPEFPSIGQEEDPESGWVWHPPENYLYSIDAVMENATATYDALGRLTGWYEAGSAATYAASTTFAYDANGNIRHTSSSFHSLNMFGAPSASAETKDTWYRYDALNRVVTAEGEFQGSPGSGAIVRGTQGADIYYDNAGQRAYTLRTDVSSVTTREDYAYTAAGQVSEVRIGDNPSAQGVIRGRYGYDLMGRLEWQKDYSDGGYQGGESGTNLVFHRTASWNSKGQIATDTTITKRGSDTYQATSTYDYGTGSSYALGSALSTLTQNWMNGDGRPGTLTTFSYDWYDGAVTSLVVYKPDAGQSAHQDTPYTYAVVGGQAQLSSVHIPGAPGVVQHDVTYRNDLMGQVLWRNEGSLGGGNPHEVFYRFGGKEMGHVSNDGTLKTSYAASIADRTAVQGTGRFHNGATTATPYAAFAESLDPVTSYAQGSSSGTYTVRAGESLSSIAVNLWGDASLWWKLAEANGLTAQSALAPGQQLAIPAGVMKSTHTAATFTPYDPAEAIGNVGPVQPKPNKHGCGVVGQVLLVVIAVIVARIATPYLASAFTSMFGGNAAAATAAATVVTPGATEAAAAAAAAELGVQGTAGVIAGSVAGGAAGSVVSQSIGVRTGIQEKFSWNAVALAGIGAGVGAGLGLNGVTGFTGGALGSAISQGVGKALHLQDKFSWAGVAAAGVGAMIPGNMGPLNTGSITARTLANAGIRTLIEGTDFGDNIRAALPDVIGSTIGEAIAGGIAERSQPRDPDTVMGFAQSAQLADGVSSLGFTTVEGEFVQTTAREFHGGDVVSKVPLAKVASDLNLDLKTLPSDYAEAYLLTYTKDQIVWIKSQSGEDRYYDPRTFQSRAIAEIISAASAAPDRIVGTASAEAVAAGAADRYAVASSMARMLAAETGKSYEHLLREELAQANFPYTPPPQLSDNSRAKAAQNFRANQQALAGQAASSALGGAAFGFATAFGADSRWAEAWLNAGTAVDSLLLAGSGLRGNAPPFTGAQRLLPGARPIETEAFKRGGPPTPYNREKHYGQTPTWADRNALGARPGQVVDHRPTLVERYYEGDRAIGEKPGWMMTAAERKASAADRARMALQSEADSRSQGGKASTYSQEKKKEFGF